MASKKIQGIVIRLGADTKPMDKALSGLNKTSASLNTELKQVNKLMKFDPGNTTLAAQKQKILSEAVQNTKTKLDGLKQAQAEVDKMYQNGDIGDKEYREFQRTVEQTEQSLKSYEGQMGKLGTEQDRLQTNTRRLQTLFDATGTSVDDFSDILGTRLTNAIKDGTASSDQLELAINKIGRASIGSDGDIGKLKEALDSIDDGDSIDSVREQIEEMGDSSDKATDKVGRLNEMVQSGMLSEVADKAGEVSQKIIDIGGAAVESAATLKANSAQFEQVFGDMTEQAHNTVNEIGDAMGILPKRLEPGYAAISSQLMSLGVDQKTAMDLAAQALTSSADAAAFYDTSLDDAQGSVQSFIKGNLSAAESIGIFASANGLSDYALQRAGTSANEAGKSYNDMTEAEKQVLRIDYVSNMQDQAKVTGQAAREMNGYENVVGNAKSAMEELKGSLGEEALNMLVGILQNLVPLIEKIVNWVEDLNPNIKQALTIVLGVTAAVGALLPIIATLSMAAVGLNTTILPLIAIIAGIIGAITAVILVIKNWGSIVDWISDKWNTFKGFISAVWGAIQNVAVAVFTAIAGFFKSIWDKIYSIFKVPLDLIKAIVTGVMYAIKAVIETVWIVITTLLGKAWDWIKNKASSIFSPLADFFSKIWNKIKDTVSNVWNSITSTLGGIWDNLKSKAMNVFGGMWDGIRGGFNTLKDDLGRIVKGIANNIISPIGKAVNGVIHGMNWILGKVGSKKKFDDWAVPKFARGAGGLSKDTIGMVNDQKGSTYREMIVPPNGQPYIPEGRDIMLPMEKGTKIMPARQTKSFLESIPHFAKGIGEFFGNAWEKVKSFTGNVWDYISHPGKIVQIAIDKFTDLSDAMEPGLSIAKGAVSSVFDGVKDFIKKQFDTVSPEVNYKVGAGVEQWRGLATQALQMTGQYSPSNLAAMLHQMQTESGGNPRAINNWDINAKRGTPSKGLMQVIDPTFRAYAMPGHNNIWDPLSNMLASIRYAVSRYGSLARAYRGRAYADGIGQIDLSDIIPSIDPTYFEDGGILTKPGFFKYGNGKMGIAGEGSTAEAITPVDKLKGYITSAILDVFGDKNINIALNITDNIDGRTLAKNQVQYTQPLLDKQEQLRRLIKEGVRI